MSQKPLNKPGSLEGFLPRNNWLRQFLEAGHGETEQKECLLRQMDFATPAAIASLGSWVLTGIMLKEVLPGIWPSGGSYSYGFSAEVLLNSTDFLLTHWYVMLLLAGGIHLLWRRARKGRIVFTSLLWMLAVLTPPIAANFAFAAFYRLGILQDKL